MKSVILPHKQYLVHSKHNSPPITLFIWDNNISWMKIWWVAEQVLPIQSKLMCFFLQKLNEYTGNPCKLNISLSQYFALVS